MSSSRNFWRRVWDRVPMFFKENIGRKLAALFLSTLIYGSVRNKVEAHVYIKDVPVRITMPDNLVLMDDAPRFVTIKLNGSKMVTQGVTENDISIDVRVVPSLYKSGSNIYPLTISLRDIKTPFGTSPVSVSPSKFNLAVNPLVSKMVEVTPDFESKPGLPSGYAIGKVSLNPKMVRIDQDQTDSPGRHYAELRLHGGSGSGQESGVDGQSADRDGAGRSDTFPRAEALFGGAGPCAGFLDGQDES